jgi:chaperonin GroES
MNIKPLQDRVIVKRAETVETTASGIVLAMVATEKPANGEVVAVGEGKVVDGKLQSMSVKVGDQIMFGKYSGQTFELDGQEFITMKEDDIIGILN